MTTEQKIKEAFESEYGTPDQWDKVDYDIALVNFRAGYLALLNSLEKSGWFITEDYDFHVTYRLPEGVTKP